MISSLLAVAWIGQQVHNLFLTYLVGEYVSTGRKWASLLPGLVSLKLEEIRVRLFLQNRFIQFWARWVLWLSRSIPMIRITHFIVVAHHFQPKLACLYGMFPLQRSEVSDVEQEDLSSEMKL